MKVFVGKTKENATRATAKLLSSVRKNFTTCLETWEVIIEGAIFTFQCYEDRRWKWARSGDTISSIETRDGKYYVWEET